MIFDKGFAEAKIAGTICSRNLSLHLFLKDVSLKVSIYRQLALHECIVFYLVAYLLDMIFYIKLIFGICPFLDCQTEFDHEIPCLRLVILYKRYYIWVSKRCLIFTFSTFGSVSSITSVGILFHYFLPTRTHFSSMLQHQCSGSGCWWWRWGGSSRQIGVIRHFQLF